MIHWLNGSLAVRDLGKWACSLPVPVLGNDDEVVKAVEFARDTTTNSTGNTAEGSGDLVISKIYQTSPDLSILKEKYHLGESQCFIF